MPHDLSLLVRYLTVRSPLDQLDRDAVLSLPFAIREAPAGAYLVREGEAATHCAVLLDGFAIRHKLSGDGARQIVSIHIPGEALDFQNIFLPVSDHNVQTLTAATLALVPLRAIDELMTTRVPVAHAVMRAMLAEAAMYREWLLNLGRRNARVRIAHLLCEFAVRIDAQGLKAAYGYNLPMTQEQIGDMTGLTAVHVNRSVRALEDEGLIQRRGRMFLFPNMQALQAAADFDPLYLYRNAHALVVEEHALPQ